MKPAYRLGLKTPKPEDAHIAAHRELAEWPFGLWGGHVAIEIDGLICGLHFISRKVSLLPSNRHKNSEFRIQTQAEWGLYTSGKRLCSIGIPATDEEKARLLAYYRNPDNLPPYAMLGERCASNAHRLLAMLNKVKSGNSILKAFYPAMLRHLLIRRAKQKGFSVHFTEGSPVRFWYGRIPASAR